MQTVAILGAGELGATLARRLAERELAQRVFLVDSDVGKAQGKALDLLQSAPVEGYDTWIAGAPALFGLPAPDAVVLADPSDLAAWAPPAPPPKTLVEALVAGARGGVVVIAGPRPGPWVEAVSSHGVPADRVFGSAAIAAAGALRRHLAEELAVEPGTVSATVMGAPPDRLIVPRGLATVGGVPVDALSPTALRRALSAVNAGRPGPVALAAAAAELLYALDRSRPTVLPVVTCLRGEYGQRDVALAVPARVAAHRLEAVVETPLEPVDRIAFDNVVGRRSAFRD